MFCTGTWSILNIPDRNPFPLKFLLIQIEVDAIEVKESAFENLQPTIDIKSI
jgi:hypothetical protein